jgi:integrase
MTRTARDRLQAKGAVFLSLSQPPTPLSAAGVAAILTQAISLAGLAHQGFTAKSFRPTGATAAVSLGHDPEKVRRLGRWKTQSVFFDHYVHTKLPSDYTDSVLKSHM